MTTDPTAIALLRRLTALRDESDPLHAFAVVVLSGEASLRAAARDPGFGPAFAEVLDDLPPPLPEPPPDAL